MTTRKRIIFSVTNDLTYDRRMNRICSALSDAGFDVTLVGRVRNDSTAFHSSKFSNKRLHCIFNKGLLFYKEFNIRLFFFLLKTKFDIACACDLDTAMASLIASKIKGKKTVYDAHEYFSEVPELTGRPIVKGIWRLIGRLTISKFNARYTVGEELAVLMGKVYHVPFDVIRNIAPYKIDETVGGNEVPREKILLYQGALNIGRGLEACIEAMLQLTDWTFWIAGEGDITDQLKEQSRKLGLEQNVKFLGWIKPDDLPGLMAKAKISINLRERGSLNDYYSLPNKFFDAIHAGLPSIHMNYPEYTNIISRYPCAILIDEVRVEQIVRAVNLLDEHPETWEKMAASCLAAANEFTWEKESKKLVQIYSKF